MLTFYKIVVTLKLVILARSFDVQSIDEGPFPSLGQLYPLLDSIQFRHKKVLLRNKSFNQEIGLIMDSK